MTLNQGKTELTIWLAGFLRVPLFRIALNDSRLTDQLFAQLVSPTSLKHDNNSVIQIDEFQETLKRWKVHLSDGQGVSMGGFCEVLQGSNSLSRGFIVLSGTHELLEIMRESVFAVVFRGVCIIAELGWLLVEDTQTFFVRFLNDFVPLCSEEELADHGPDFTRKILDGVVSKFPSMCLSSFGCCGPRAIECPFCGTMFWHPKLLFTSLLACTRTSLHG